MADDEFNTPRTYAPPGYTLLLVLVAANGLEAVRDLLARGVWQAFGLDWDTPGGLVPISREHWWSPHVRETLETGEWSRRRRWVSSAWTSTHVPSRYETFTVVVADPPTPAPEIVASPEPAPESAGSEQVPPEPSDPPPAAWSEAPKLHGVPGAKPKFDRDAVQAYCYRWFDDNGVPDNVTAFCRDNVLAWCGERYDEDETPELETLRPYVKKWIDVWVRSNSPPE